MQIRGLFLLVLLSPIAQAEVLSIAAPSYSTPNTVSGVIRPQRGLSMARVEQQFGTPTDKRAAVGEPPITRWRYTQFDVFFEDQLVIHSVIKRTE